MQKAREAHNQSMVNSRLLAYFDDFNWTLLTMRDQCELA